MGLPHISPKIYSLKTRRYFKEKTRRSFRIYQKVFFANTKIEEERVFSEETKKSFSQMTRKPFRRKRELLLKEAKKLTSEKSLLRKTRMYFQRKGRRQGGVLMKDLKSLHRRSESPIKKSPGRIIERIDRLI